MQKITKGQKKIVISVGLAIVVFIIFSTLVYLPTKRRMDQLRDEYLSIQREIDDFRSSVGNNRPLDEIVMNLRKKLDTFRNIFPDKEELVLRELPDLAAKVGVEITSIRPQLKRNITDMGGVPIMVKGCVIQEMQIAVTLRAPYKTLGEFFRILKTEFPIFVRVDNVQIVKGTENMLDVNLSLNTYMISSDNMFNG